MNPGDFTIGTRVGIGHDTHRPRPGSKLEKAQQLGVPVLNEEQFERLLSGETP